MNKQTNEQSMDLSLLFDNSLGFVAATTQLGYGFLGGNTVGLTTSGFAVQCHQNGHLLDGELLNLLSTIGWALWMTSQSNRAAVHAFASCFGICGMNIILAFLVFS